MKKFFLLILISVETFFSVNAQIAFQKTYGQPGGDTTFESSTDVALSFDGGYVVLGFNPLGIYLLKTNAIGDTVWTRTYNCNNGFLLGSSIRQTTDSGYIIAGRRLDNFGSEQIMIIKTDSTGNISWSKLYGGIDPVVPGNVEQTTDGGYIFAGYVSYGNFDADVYVVKLDSIGNVEWSGTYGDAQWNAARHIEQTTDGGYIISGFYENAISYLTHIMLMKISSTGTLTWVRKFSGMTEDYPNYVKQTSDGGYILIGFTNSFNSTQQTFLMKTNNLGAPQWTKAYPGGEGMVVDELQNGDYVFAGRSFSSGPILVKTNSFGDTLWAKIYDVPLQIFSDGYSFKATTDGGFIFCGDVSLPTDTGSIYLVKTDSTGSGVCFNTAQNLNYSSVGFGQTNLIFSSSTLDTSSAVSIQEVYYGINVTDLCFTEISEVRHSENNFSLYPNPSNGIFTLKWDMGQGPDSYRGSDKGKKCEIEIYNSLGEIVFRSEIRSRDIGTQSEIDLSDEPNGIYFVTVKNETQSFTQKISIEK
jgi:hypothetical protein